MLLILESWRKSFVHHFVWSFCFVVNLFNRAVVKYGNFDLVKSLYSDLEHKPFFNLHCDPINIWVNNREAGDLRYHCACYDVTVMAEVNFSLYNDFVIRAMVSQIPGVSIVCSTVYSGSDQRKYESSMSLDFCDGNPPVTGGFLSRRTSNMENVSICWCHNDHWRTSVKSERKCK